MVVRAKPLLELLQGVPIAALSGVAHRAFKHHGVITVIGDRKRESVGNLTALFLLQ